MSAPWTRPPGSEAKPKVARPKLFTCKSCGHEFSKKWLNQTDEFCSTACREHQPIKVKS